MDIDEREREIMKVEAISFIGGWEGYEMCQHREKE